MILLTGHWDEDGNLVIEASASLSDSTSDEELEELAKGYDWAYSYLVDTHDAAAQMAYAEHIHKTGGKLIDEAEGFIPDTR